MALHNTFGDFNRRGNTRPVVKYSATPYTFDFYGQNVIACWILKRTSSFDFEYIGMDEATAQQCADAMRDIYTRRYMRWTATVTSKDSTDKPNVVISPTYNFECTSDIQPRLVAGDNWSVTCSVRDEDTVISLEEPKSTADFERIFKLAEDRDTPIAIGSITILNASWRSDIDDGTVIAEYDAKILNFDENLLSAQVLVNGAWVTPETVRRSGGKVEFYADSNVTFRLTYSSGAVLSQEWTTTDPVRPPITITNVYIDEVEGGTGNYTFFTNMYWTAEFETQLDPSRVLQIKSWDMMMTAGGRTYGNGQRDDSSAGMKIERIGDGKYRLRSGIIFDTPPPATAVGSAMVTYRPLGIDSQAFTTVKPIFRLSLNNVTVVDRIDDGDTMSYVFEATIRTNGPSDDEITSQASMKLRDTHAVYGEIITPVSQTITKTGDGTFSVRAKFSGFKKPTSGVSVVYAHVGVTCGTNLFWLLQYSWDPRIPLAILSAENVGPSRFSIAFEHHIDGFDAANLKAYKFFGFDTVWSEVTIVSRDNGSVMVAEPSDSRWLLVYESGTTRIESKPFANPDVKFIDVTAARLDGDEIVADLAHGGLGEFAPANIHVQASSAWGTDLEIVDASEASVRFKASQAAGVVYAVIYSSAGGSSTSRYFNPEG